MGFECKSNLVQSPVATAHKTEHNLSQLATSTERNLQVLQYYKVYICCQSLLSGGIEDGENKNEIQFSNSFFRIQVYYMILIKVTGKHK